MTDAELLQEHELRITTVETDMRALKSAFPAGDTDGHRRYHELIIEEIDAKKRLRHAIIEKTIPGILWAALVWVLFACWNSLKALLVFAAK